MSFKDQSFATRFSAMGDEAEQIFEAWAASTDLKFVRYGLNRPPIAMHKLPARLRYTPDYLTSGHLIEVQGFGQDQICKLKIDKWMSLHYWNTVHPVNLFIWDRSNRRYAIVKLAQFDSLLAEGNATIGQFPEGHGYLAVDARPLFEHAEQVGEIDADS